MKDFNYVLGVSVIYRSLWMSYVVNKLIYSITDKAIEPLRAQLTEVDQAIKDQLDLIAAVKSNIIRNDQKIDKMLRSIAKSWSSAASNYSFVFMQV